MKETIIIIDGCDYIKSESRFLQKLILIVYRMFNVVPLYSNEAFEWAKRLEKKEREVIFFDWSHSFWPSEVTASSEALKDLIAKKGPVRIVSFSMGSQLAINAARASKNVLEILSVSGVFRPHHIDAPFVEVRSSTDYFGNFWRDVFWVFSFHKKMHREIFTLHGIRHDEFHRDIPIQDGEFRGRKISWVIDYLLERSARVC